MDVAKEFVEIDADVLGTIRVQDEDTYKLLKEKDYTVIMDGCIKVEHAMTK